MEQPIFRISNFSIEEYFNAFTFICLVVLYYYYYLVAEAQLCDLLA